MDFLLVPSVSEPLTACRRPARKWFHVGRDRKGPVSSVGRPDRAARISVRLLTYADRSTTIVSAAQS
jgi:hypothetical protein